MVSFSPSGVIVYSVMLLNYQPECGCIMYVCLCERLGWKVVTALCEFFGQRLGIYFTVIDGLFFFVFPGINTSHVIPWIKEMQSVFVWLIKSF